MTPKSLFDMARAYFGEEYRGYRLTKLEVACSGKGYLHAFCSLSPLYPRTMMVVEIPDLSEDERVLDTVLANAAFSLQQLIDTAYRDQNAVPDWNGDASHG